MMLIARKGFALVLWTAAALVAAQPATGFAQAGSDSQMANALTNLDQYVKDSMAKTKVPGVSVAVVYQDLRQGVLDSSTNYSQEKPPGNPSPGAPVSSFLGTYSNPYFGKVEIEEHQGKLILRLPPLGAYYELSHWDGNTYAYLHRKRGVGGGAAVRLLFRRREPDHRPEPGI